MFRLDASPARRFAAVMCNLYSMTKGQAAIRQFFRVGRDLTGNLPSLPAIFPDMLAPIARVAEDGERQFEMMHWGMPGPSQYGGAAVTNIRNTRSPHWWPWLGPAIFAQPAAHLAAVARRQGRENRRRTLATQDAVGANIGNRRPAFQADQLG